MFEELEEPSKTNKMLSEHVEAECCRVICVCSVNTYGDLTGSQHCLGSSHVSPWPAESTHTNTHDDQIMKQDTRVYCSILIVFQKSTPGMSFP